MRETTIRVRIPQLCSVENAVRLYYEKSELTSADIKRLFDIHSSATVTKLKALAREKMIEEKIPARDSRNVNTAMAYKAWGLDISDLEQRLKKLRELRELTA